jgi:ribonuclease HI
MNKIMYYNKILKVLNQEEITKLIKEENYENIFTDGCCLQNQSKNGIVGIGVYYENNTTKNISKKIPELKTNNQVLKIFEKKAELMAIYEGVILTESEQNVIIHSGFII